MPLRPPCFDSTYLLSFSLLVAGHSWQPRHLNSRLLGPSNIIHYIYFDLNGSRRLRPLALLVLLSICCCSGLPPLSTTSNSPLRVYFFSFVAVALASCHTAQFRTRIREYYFMIHLYCCGLPPLSNHLDSPSRVLFYY